MTDFSHVLQWVPLLMGIQIGPRIRVGGTVGNAAQKIKIGTGKVAKVAAPFAALIPGVGPLIAAGLGAAGTVMDTSKGSVGLGDVAKTGAINYGIGKVGGKVLSTVGSRMLGNAGSDVSAGGGGGTGIMDRAKQLLLGGGGGTGTGGGMGLLDKILLGGTVAASTEDALRRRKMEDEARRYATEPYNARAGLRSRALQMLERDTTPNHAALFRDPGNVYDVQRRQQIAMGG